MLGKDRTSWEATREDARDSQLFDELSKGIAAGTISRRRALRQAVAAVLGAALVPSLLASPAEATHRREGCRGKEPISNRACPRFRETICHRTETKLCQCVRTTEGTKRCVNTTNIECEDFLEGDECDSSRDCPSDSFCIQAGACCGGTRNNICARRC
jgi:hypothetical protein